MPDYSREELVTELKRRRATQPLEMQPSHVPYSWETPEASLRRIEGIPEGYGETEPWIDPTSVFAAGAGSGVRAGLQAGKPLISAAMQGLRSGLAGAAMDYPVGTVAGAVGEKYPSMALPLSVGLGIASGKYIEPKLEAGLRKLPEYAAEAAPYARMKLAEQRGSFSTKPVEEPGYKPFYSQLENVIESKVQTQKPVDPEAFKQILKPEHGVKQDELTNTKIKDFLEGKKVVGEKVSKNDVLDYLKEQRTEMKDVMLGGENLHTPLRAKQEELLAEQNQLLDKIRPAINIRELYDNPDYINTLPAGVKERAKRLMGIDDEYKQVTKQIQGLGPPPKDPQFSTYQEPGGTNYREMFVTAPEIEKPSPTSLKDYAEYYWGNKYDNLSEKEITEAKEQYHKGFRREDEAVSWQDGHPEYKDIVNPVVRVRFNERTDDAGRKILFIEEIQGPSKENQAKMPEWLHKRQYDIGVKRALKYAADNGFDGISWTPGGVQASRYDLSKQIKQLDYTKNPDGTFNIIAAGAKGEGLVFEKERLSPSDLENHVGKELTAKITKGEGVLSDNYAIIAEGGREVGGGYTLKEAQEFLKKRPNEGYSIEPPKTKSLSSLDLKVGGEGLTSLYDKILPKKFQEITKGKVGETKMDKLGDIPFIPVPKEAKKGYPLYAAIPALGLAGQEEEQPQYTRAELVEELKRRRRKISGGH